MKQYDAVVIGAGNAGLTAATTLQREGCNTLLLERHNIPGGCATSFVRGDYEFEVALHQLSGLGTEQRPFVMRKLFTDLGVMDKVEFVQESELYRFVVPDELDTTLPASWNGVRLKLQADFPEESQQIADFLKLCETICLESFMMLPQALKSNSESMLKKNCPNYINYGMRSAKDVLDEFFKDEKLKTIVSAYWCYMGVPPKDIPFPDLAMMFYAYAAFKPWHIKGGSQAMSSALLEAFIEAGGEVRFNCGAEKILTNGNTVRGVRTEDGDEVACSAVVSNASSIITYNELLDHDQPPLQVREDFRSRRMGTSAFVIYMGLDCTPKELGITSASNFVCNTQDEDKIHDCMQTMNAPIAGMLTCYNFDDPDFAPEGKSVVTLVCLQYGDQWKDIAEENYAQRKYQFAEQLIDLIAQVFPKIRDHIEELEVATPLTMMRYLNTPDGAIYGFKQNPQDSKYFRERIDSISGLYMAGCWSTMGGFQPTYMAGQSAAKAVAKQLKAQHKEVANV